MAGTREILTGCRNDVGASLLFPLAKGLAEELELARYGVELIDLPIMASNLNSKSSPAVIFYANPLRMAGYVLRHFGVRAMIGFVRLMAFCSYPASPGRAPSVSGSSTIFWLPASTARVPFDFDSVASSMFIAGLPMKPPTKRLTGWS